MSPRYLICDNICCHDSEIIGELACEPKKGTEYVYKNGNTEKEHHTGRTIQEVSDAFNQNIDLKLTLDDSTVVYIVVL